MGARQRHSTGTSTAARGAAVSDGADAVQGCRIDYVLVSPGLTGQLGPCEVLLDLPPKWSDHAPVKLTLPDLPPTPAHAPCPLSSHRHPRFSTRTQPSVASLFARSGTR